jgi:hypothetical protein
VIPEQIKEVLTGMMLADSTIFFPTDLARVMPGPDKVRTGPASNPPPRRRTYGRCQPATLALPGSPAARQPADRTIENSFYHLYENFKDSGIAAGEPKSRSRVLKEGGKTYIAW